MRTPRGSAVYRAGAGDVEAARGSVAALRDLVDAMQLARAGNPELDRRVAEMLRQGGEAAPDGAHWSRDLDDAMRLLPRDDDYNYSLGRRDGVCWAWVQPNDRWEPNEYQARHDHPRGSGLVVAHSAALAVTCAAVILRIREIEAGAATRGRIEGAGAMAESSPAA